MAYTKQQAQINTLYYTLYGILWVILHIPVNREESIERNDKGIAMAQ